MGEMNTSNMAITMSELLNKLHDVKRAYLWKLSQKHNLTPLQMQILECIKKFGKDAPPSSYEIAEEIMLSRATVSVALKALERKELVVKTFSGKDRRKQFLALKGRAEDILSETAQYEDIIVRGISRLPEKSVTSILNVFIHILGMMYDEGIVDRVAVCLKCAWCRSVSKNLYQCDVTGRRFSIAEAKIGCRNFTMKEGEKHAAQLY